MADTANLELPLLAAGQAQKHVTVNEALSRLDLLVMLSVKSRSLATPPGSAVEGDRYVAPSGASGAWTGQGGKVAIFLNGGWEFAAPLAGWRAFVEDEGLEVVYAAGAWTTLTLPAAASGAISVVEFEHTLSAGGVQSTVGQIPGGSIVFGVTMRVMDEITGVSGWSLGVSEADARYGSDHATGAGAGISGVRGAPLYYAADISLRLTPEGGVFSGGRVKFHIHRMTLSPPAA